MTALVVVTSAFATAAAAADSSSSGSVTVPVALGNVSGPGQLTVDVAHYSDYNSSGVPQIITETPVETASVPSGGNQAIQVPLTPAVSDAAQAGTANLQITATFGNQVSVADAPVSVNPASVTAASTANVSRTRTPLRPVRFAPFHRVKAPTPGVAHAASPVPPPCTWSASGSQVDQSARTGELHVANVAGASAVYDYTTQADSTFGVEFSDSGPSSGYSASGTASVTNSFGGNGSTTGGQGFLWYIDGHFYSQTYSSNINPNNDQPACGSNYMTQVVSAVGDSFQGSNQPPSNPYGSCTSDPYGYATVNKNGGTYSADRGQAQSYGVALSIFGVGLSGDTGFSSDIHIAYTNNGSTNRYVCGSAYLPNAPILYES